jgi:hypothetical protein
MALILNIHTAVETASVCLAKDGEILFISKKIICIFHLIFIVLFRYFIFL